MANLNKLFSGTISVTYRNERLKTLPLKFFAPCRQEAEKVAFAQALSTLIIEESPDLENATTITVMLAESEV